MIDFLETGQADDVARTGVLGLDLLQARVSEKRGHVRAFASPVAMNADNRITDRDTPAYDASVARCGRGNRCSARFETSI